MQSNISQEDLLQSTISAAKKKRASYRLLSAINYKRRRPNMAQKGIPSLDLFESLLFNNFAMNASGMTSS